MQPVLQIDGVAKSFGGVAALRGVSFSVATGMRHALLGENGAGKSTLIKILSGEHQPDGGTILLDGQPFRVANPAEARRAGISVVPQELSYCSNLPVSENLLLGETPAWPGRFGLLKRTTMREEALKRLARLGLNDINPDWPMARLSTGQAQAAQIAAAIARHPKLLLLDEPTSALSRGEAQQLARILSQLKAEGVTVLYVSHRMEEIFGSADSGFTPCDDYSVLRDGQHVESGAVASKTPRDIVRAMIGRDLQQEHLPHLDRTFPVDAPIRLKLEKLSDSTRGRFQNIDLEIRAGEVVGLAGLVGAGRTELARAIVGLDSGATGRVQVKGVAYENRSVRESLKRGLVYLTEDRKREGLVLGMSGCANWSLPFVSRFSALGGAILFRGRERSATSSAFETLRVKTRSPDAAVKNLSGGNQQKVLFARWLSVLPEPTVIILDEPTRGVDVGAKAEIHRLIAELSLRGAAILAISSDLPELLTISTRLAILRKGELAGTMQRSEMSEDAAGRTMVGV